jgi:hypothetical protein
MKKLIPDHMKELEAIARRMIVMKMEDQNSDLNGMLAVVRNKINNQILELGEWAGENGRLWRNK